MQPLQRALQLVRVQLQSQGMKLVVRGCPSLRLKNGVQQVLDVHVQVTDSDVAADFVRGPLADGEPVDLGGMHLSMTGVVQSADAAALQEEEGSPDVLFNRQWLAALMHAQGFYTVEGHWWAFAFPRNKLLGR